MAICNNCGTQIADGTQFCPSCGADQTLQPPYNQGQQSYTQQEAQGAPNYESETQAKAEEAWKKFSDTNDFSAQYHPQDIDDNKVLALFSYLGILFLIPLLAAPNSQYAKFHTNQGLILFIVEIAYAVLVTILSIIFSFIPVVRTIMSIVFSIIWIIPFVFAIIGIVNTLNGKAKELPLIGKYRILK